MNLLDTEKMSLNIDIGSMGNVIGESFRNEALVKARQEMTNLQDWLKKGDKNLNHLCLAAGCLTAFSGFLGIFNIMSPLNMLLEVYNFLFGLLIIILELQYHALGGQLVSRPRKFIEEYAKFLSLSNGRGIFYIYVGSISLSRWTFFNILLGGFLVACGSMSIAVGQHVQAKLDGVRQKLVGGVI
jgi:hypothetical protein